jgi:hypothetical protein
MAWQLFNQLKLEVEVDEIAVKLGRTVDAVSFLTKLIKQIQEDASEHIATSEQKESEIQCGYIEENLEEDTKFEPEEAQIKTLEHIGLIDVSDDEYIDDESGYISNDDLEDDDSTKQVIVDLSSYEPNSSLSSQILSESDVKLKMVNAIVPDNTLEDNKADKPDESDYKKMPVAEIRKIASLKFDIDASKYKKTQLVEMLLKPLTPPLSPLHFFGNCDDDVEEYDNIVDANTDIDVETRVEDCDVVE